MVISRRFYDLHADLTKAQIRDRFLLDLSLSLDDLIAAANIPNIDIAGGLVWKGAYNGATDYTIGDAVSYLNESYVMYIDAVAGTLPTDGTKWQKIAAQGAKGNDGLDASMNLEGGNATSIYGGVSPINCGGA